MIRNVGTTDRWLRIGAGLALLGSTWAGWIGAWGAIGIIPLVTGAIGTCPLYRAAGVNTCGCDELVKGP